MAENNQSAPTRMAGPLAKHVLGTRLPKRPDFDKPEKPDSLPFRKMASTVLKITKKHKGK